MESAGKQLLALTNVTKTFGDTVALRDVSFALASHETVALAGGNGSGKSTLLKIIAGALSPDQGSISYSLAPYRTGDVKAARHSGVEMLYQDCSLCGNVGVLENIFMGREITSPYGMMQFGKMRRQAAELIAKYQLPVPSLSKRVNNLSGGQQKAVALCRALLACPSLLLLDEPTAALGVREQQIILKIVNDLKERGIAIIYCTHSPDEILAVADRLLVLRNGELIKSCSPHELSRAELALFMST